MSYNNEKLPDEPIIINTLYEGFDVATDQEASTREVFALLNEASEPVYFIADVRAPRFEMDDIVEGTTLASLGDNALLRHPNIKQVLFVVTDVVLKTAVTGLRDEAFGNIDVHVFSSLEDALEHARSDQ